MRSPGRVEGRARRHGGMQLRRQVRPRPYRPRTSDVPDFSSWPIATTQPRSHFFHASPQDTRARAGARPGARADARPAARSTGSPTPESIRALASLFGGTGGFVSHDTIWRWCACRGDVLTTRLYSLFPRHTLEAFLTTLANVHARVHLRTPRAPWAPRRRSRRRRRGSSSRSRCTTWTATRRDRGGAPGDCVRATRGTARRSRPP